MIQFKDWTLYSRKHPETFESLARLIRSELNWAVEFRLPEKDEIFEVSKLSEFQIHRFDLQESPKLLTEFPAQPERVKLVETMDCLSEKQKNLWPELFLVPAVRRALRRRVKTLDLRRSAFVVGDDLQMRPLVMAAAELGFSRIFLVSPEIDWLEEEKKFLQRRLVGIQLESVLTTDLTLQAQDTHLLLNALNLHEHSNYLQDLAYFNFMVSGGVVVDLFSQGPHQTLQEEAIKAQLTCIKPVEVSLAWWLEAGLKYEKPLLATKDQENLLFQKAETLD